MKPLIVVVTALFAGFAGGVVGTLAVRPREQPRIEQVVRARSFELVDKNGSALSYWGVDKQDNVVQVAFAGVLIARFLAGPHPIDFEGTEYHLYRAWNAPAIFVSWIPVAIVRWVYPQGGFDAETSSCASSGCSGAPQVLKLAAEGRVSSLPRRDPGA
jgi:hypothetical protein